MKEAPERKFNLMDFALVSLMPLVFGKLLILFFGSMYSVYPGEGYGIGLLASLAFTLIMVAKFIWKYRNYQED